jgi:hypothetical protein
VCPRAVLGLCSTELLHFYETGTKLGGKIYIRGHKKDEKDRSISDSYSMVRVALQDTEHTLRLTEVSHSNVRR